MGHRVRVLGTGVRVDLRPDPETALFETAQLSGEHVSPEDRAELGQWRAGEVVFVQLTSFVKFDDGSGSQQRWEGAPQGPYALPLTHSATSALLSLVASVDDPLLADFGISGMPVSRFEFHPRRIDIDPALASCLTLD